MRTVNVVLDGVEFEMPVSFAVFETITNIVCDPFKFVLQASQGAVDLTGIQIIDTLVTGIHATGDKTPRAEIAQKIVTAGVMEYLDPAMDYLLALASADIEIKEDDTKKK